MLYTVLDFVRETVDGVASPGLDQLSVAYLNPPTSSEGAANTMLLFVWSDGVGEKRQTMPRQQNGIASSGGFKRVTHNVSIYAMLIGQSSNHDLSKAFFQGLDAIMASLRAVEIPVSLTDPDTGILTYITEVGEDFKLQTDVVRSLSDQRYVRMLAKLTTTAYEQVQS